MSLDGTRALLDLGTAGSAQGPLGVALLLHRVELNVGAKAERPLSRSSLGKACLTTAGTLLQPSATKPTSTAMPAIR